MVHIAAAGHRTLCLGQGAELLWARQPAPLSPPEVVDIFRLKTAPAFEVALHLGAAYAGADADDAPRRCSRYSEALGIAYQMRDDLADLGRRRRRPRRPGRRPAVAAAGRGLRARRRETSARCWRRPGAAQPERDGDLRAALESLGAESRCRGLLEAYKEEAVRSLAELQNASLKGLLRRVVGQDLQRGDPGMVQ